MEKRELTAWLVVWWMRWSVKEGSDVRKNNDVGHTTRNRGCMVGRESKSESFRDIEQRRPSKVEEPRAHLEKGNR